MKAAGTILLALALLGVCAALEVKVTLNVFSGTEDPSWIVRDEAAAQLLSAMPSDAFLRGLDVPRPIPWYRMGYRGFEVAVLNEEGVAKAFAIYNSPEAEMVLLRSANMTLPLTVVTHVRDETIRLTNLMEEFNGNPPDAVAPAENHPNAPCDLPVRGPDNVTTYAPSTENCGYFVKHCSENNCYNYGNDIVTNTFAQPGRGSGQKWSYNTCEDIKNSAIRDGLVWAGTTLPKVNPAIGHYVALLIWPNTNFHWIRLDSVPAGGWWSHKPGQTPVRNVDNNNKKISDPSVQDFSPWSQFCGYMTTVPSTARIG